MSKMANLAMLRLAFELTHQKDSELMYEKYLQVSVHPGNHEGREDLLP